MLLILYSRIPFIPRCSLLGLVNCKYLMNNFVDVESNRNLLVPFVNTHNTQRTQAASTYSLIQNRTHDIEYPRLVRSCKWISIQLITCICQFAWAWQKSTLNAEACVLTRWRYGCVHCAPVTRSNRRLTRWLWPVRANDSAVIDSEMGFLNGA